MHTQASQLFHTQCAQLPHHTMHVYARMVTTLYLVARYGQRVQAHKARLARALERMEQSQ